MKRIDLTRFPEYLRFVCWPCRDNTEGLLLYEPDDDLAPFEIWCGTPTGANVITTNG